MFYYLEGPVTIIEQNLAVVDIGGAGYACHTSLYAVASGDGKEGASLPCCNIKEDAFDIYGFMTRAKAFLKLRSRRRSDGSVDLVSGTPRPALAIINEDEFAHRRQVSANLPSA